MGNLSTSELICQTTLPYTTAWRTVNVHKNASFNDYKYIAVLLSGNLYCILNTSIMKILNVPFQISFSALSYSYIAIVTEREDNIEFYYVQNASSGGTITAIYGIK